MTALAPACTLDEVPPLPVEPPPERAIYSVAECHVTFRPDEALRLYVELSTERWSRATGCAIEVSDAGVPVVLDAPILRPDGSDAPGSTSEDRSLVRINRRSRPAQQERVVNHELGHALGGDHVAGFGVLSGEKGHGDAIDLAALESVCARLPCRWLTPE